MRSRPATCFLAATAAVLIGTAPSSAAPPPSEPRTFDELRRTLPAPGPERTQRLDRFVRDRRPALSDRLLALSALRRAVAADAPEQLDVALLDAHLRAVGEAQVGRLKALRRARSILKAEADLAAAAKEGDRRSAKKRKRSVRSKRADDNDSTARRPEQTEELLARVELVLDGDDALVRLRRATEKRGKDDPRTSPTSPELLLVSRLEAALPAYAALGDVRQEGEARFALARFLEATDASREDVDRAWAALVRVGGTDRDVSPVRQRVRRARARLLVELGNWPEAAHESLVADRAARRPPHQPAFDTTATNPYGRSRETAELCWQAHQQGTSCAQIEQDRMGELSFFDFSKERYPEFEPERAQMAFVEYQPLLTACVQETARKERLLENTHIELEWAIGLDGKVPEYTVSPRRLRKTAFDTCLGQAFDRFRYPRYRGEMQHTQLAFDVGS